MITNPSEHRMPKEANPHYVTVSDEEAKARTIILKGNQVLDLLDPRLVARMTKGKYRTQHGNMIQPDV